MTCHMTKPGQLSPLDCFQEGFLRTYQAGNLVVHVLSCLVLPVIDTKQLPQALIFKGLDLPFCVSQVSHP